MTLKIKSTTAVENIVRTMKSSGATRVTADAIGVNVHHPTTSTLDENRWLSHLSAIASEAKEVDCIVMIVGFRRFLTSGKMTALRYKSKSTSLDQSPSTL